MKKNTKSGDTWVGTAAPAINRGQLEACLVHIYPSGPNMGRRYPLQSEVVHIGRGDQVDIRIQDNSVSRTHAKIEPMKEGFFLLDTNSLNGTYVNDCASQGAYCLQDGDYVRIGNTIFRFLTGGNIEAEYHEEIYRLTIIDGLTQIHNNRYLMDFLDREVARSVRHHRPLAFLMMDLDRFKIINDEHGHLCGDYILREVSNQIRHAVRREDLFARYGGEEFALVLVETNIEQALEVAERIRISVAEKPFLFESVSVSVTISIGVSSIQNDITTANTLIKNADDHLFEAKRRGRNCVVAEKY